MNGIGVVIVTHNSARVVGTCLRALRQTSAEVVVVDNASEDGTGAEVLKHSGTALIVNPWNRGFAAAVNQGIAALNQEYVLLLNPDAEPAGGLEVLAAACRAPEVAAAGGKLVDRSGAAQQGFMVRRFPTALSLSLELLGINRLWPGNPVNRRYRCHDLDPEGAADVEQPAGAFLMLRREVWRKLGGFDESFRPLWFEDVDFCRRARDAGYRIRYVPGAVARHQGGHSAAQLTWGNRELFWCGNLLIYAAKHFRPLGFAAVWTALVLGSCPRIILGIFRLRSLKPVSIYARVIRLAGRMLFSGRREKPRLSSAFAGR